MCKSVNSGLHRLRLRVEGGHDRPLIKMVHLFYNEVINDHAYS